MKIKINDIIIKVKNFVQDPVALGFSVIIIIFLLTNLIIFQNAREANQVKSNKEIASQTANSKNEINSPKLKDSKTTSLPTTVNIQIAQNEVKDLASKATLVSITQLSMKMSDLKYRKAYIDSQAKAIMLINTSKANLPNLVAYYPDELGDKLISRLYQLNTDTTTGLSFGLNPTKVNPKENNWSQIIFWALIIILGLSYLRRRQNINSEQYFTNQGSESSKSSYSNFDQVKIPSDRFTDVAGVDEAVAEMKELVDFLRDPKRFEITGAKPPRGVILTGPPGTGKTLLARAVAGEAGATFFPVAGSDFVEKYVGVGAKRVRELFAKAKKAEKAIVFIDEIDALARRRSNDSNNGSSESDNTLIALLAEMDGFTGTHVIVLAATNRVEVLDPAILRPGRLDRKITVPLPDRKGREQILEVHAKGKPLASKINFANLARRTPGMSGADLANLVNEAALEAARDYRKQITENDFAQAIETVAMGRARVSALVTPADRAITAWHEAGHTLCAHLQVAADDPVAVSIIPRGEAGGVTWMSGNDDLFLSKEKALAKIVTAMGGRAGEELHLNGSYTQGAYSDLQNATEIALTMATKYGMTELGLMVRDYESYSSEETTKVVEEILAQALLLARKILAENKKLMQLLVEALLDKDTLNHAEIAHIIKSNQPKFYYSQEIIIKEHVKLKSKKVKSKANNSLSEKNEPEKTRKESNNPKAKKPTLAPLNAISTTKAQKTTATKKPKKSNPPSANSKK